jgi:hypothetical protein
LSYGKQVGLVATAPFDLDRFLASDPGGPVVMLDLLRFAPAGAERYDDYRRALAASGVAAIAHLREASLADAVLQPTPWVA